MKYQQNDILQYDARYGQPISKDGCGVFGVIRKPDAPKISNTIAVEGISCIKYRGSNLGAGYASFDTSDGNKYEIKAFVREESFAKDIEEKISNLLGPPVSASLSTPQDTGKSGFGIFSARYKYSPKDLELERRVDEINSTLLRDRRVDARIFSYGRYMSVYKEVGYPLDVARLFGLDLEERAADMWISHTRQPTNSPGSSPIWSHPFASLDCAIVHNGDISSFGANLEFLTSFGYMSHVGTDSEVVSRLLFHLIRKEGLSVAEAATILTNPFEEDMPQGAFELLSRFRGAKLDGPFVIVAGYSDESDSYLIALTDRSKFRPIVLGEDEHCFYAASEEVQIRNLSKYARVWTPDPGSYFIASLKHGLLERGTERKLDAIGSGHIENEVISTSSHLPSPEIDSTGMGFSQINEKIFHAFNSGTDGLRITNLSGQRYLGIGISTKRDAEYRPFKVELVGYPGNCLANLNNGAFFEVFGNVADDVGDTMHYGKIVVHGSARDVVAQTLQGGSIFIRGTVGNRAAIQMREYQSEKPFLVVGEAADDYLGEYMAGGIVAVLNLSGQARAVGNFVGTGMVGGTIYIRGKVEESKMGLTPKKADVLSYLKGFLLDGVVSEEVYTKISSLTFPSERELEALLPDTVFKRLRLLFFRNKYTKPISHEYRKLNQNDSSVLSIKLQEFFEAFDIPEQQRQLVLNSEFTIIKTIEEEKESPVPPQEIPVEE